MLVLLGVLPVMLLGWRLPQPEALELHAQTLTVMGAYPGDGAAPAGYSPWPLAGNANAEGWLHVFADQAPVAELQPFYQWLWTNRKSN